MTDPTDKKEAALLANEKARKALDDFEGHKPTLAEIVACEAAHGRVRVIYFESEDYPEDGEAVLFKLPTVGQMNAIINQVAADGSNPGSLQSRWGADLIVWPDPKTAETRVLRSFPGAYGVVADEAAKLARGMKSKLAKKVVT